MSWNIQWGRGADGWVDLDRTIASIRQSSASAITQAPDVICLQEVSRNLDGLAGGNAGDAVMRLAAAFPEHTAVFGAAIDVASGDDGARAAFGNLMLSRYPVLQVFRHLLPWPSDPKVPSMQRACLELVVAAPFGPLRVMTTHLEYYSRLQRCAQIAALRTLQHDVAGHASRKPHGKDRNPAFAPRPRPVDAVLCGDFNFAPESAEYEMLSQQPELDGSGWTDAWPITNHTAHAHTVGLHGAEWPKYPYCCDYFWVAGSINSRVRGVRVDELTAASDHQPVILTLDDR